MNKTRVGQDGFNDVPLRVDLSRDYDVRVKNGETGIYVRAIKGRSSGFIRHRHSGSR